VRLCQCRIPRRHSARLRHWRAGIGKQIGDKANRRNLKFVVRPGLTLYGNSNPWPPVVSDLSALDSSATTRNRYFRSSLYSQSASPAWPRILWPRILWS